MRPLRRPDDPGTGPPVERAPTRATSVEPSHPMAFSRPRERHPDDDQAKQNCERSGLAVPQYLAYSQGYGNNSDNLSDHGRYEEPCFQRVDLLSPFDHLGPCAR